MQDIATQIITRFHLFKGLRPVDEDTAIFEKVFDQCVNVLIGFIDQHLSEAQKKELSIKIGGLERLIDSPDTYSETVGQSIIQEILTNPQKVIELQQQINSCINNLFTASLPHSS